MEAMLQVTGSVRVLPFSTPYLRRCQSLSSHRVPQAGEVCFLLWLPAQLRSQESGQGTPPGRQAPELRGKAGSVLLCGQSVYFRLV